MDGTPPHDPATPMMAQYLEIRARHPGCLLFYRMGDFYELFFEDAERAAQALDIALTRRGRHEGAEVPMCGVPAHNADGHLLSLIRKGFRVAVAEQLETPEEARAAGRKLVRRDVVRVVTPGTLTEDALLDARRHNYLASVAAWGERAAVAWADVSTGAFAVQGCAEGEVGAALDRLSPSEVLVAPGAPGAEGAQATERPGLGAEAPGAGRRLAAWFGVATLDGFGAFDAHEVAALVAVTDYLDLTQKGARAHLRPPTREDAGDCMAIDAGTCASLEIMAGPQGRAGSLIAVIDRTITAAGGRLLARRLGAPSRRLDVVNARLDAVAALAAPRAVRAALRGAPDLDRAMGRLSVGRGTPRDLAALRDGLHVAQAVTGALPSSLPPLLAGAARDLGGLEALRGRLSATLAPDPPAQGEGAVAPGASAHLDALRTLRDDARGAVAALQARYAALAGVPSLKVRHNGTLGFFVETTATHAERMLKGPLDATFIHRQTTANLLRFTTLELGEFERRIGNAAEEAEALEARLVADLREAVLAEADALGRLAAALAEIDVAAGLADLAAEERWVRPVVDASRALTVEGGRHAVVEAALRKQGKPFVANACDLTAAPLLVVTGPNMGGKSTFLRQVALLVILAQAGSFVPATSARIGLVSRVFSRVGASDDLARGRSTFMVEMVETAAILNEADDRALVVLDEIGRGTATWDGLSIAWAVLEHLHDATRCRALFATHFHEVAGVAERLEGAANAHLAVADWEGEAVFLHEVRPGPASRSYGVQVARLAGLPARVVDRARALLAALEARARDGRGGEAVLDGLTLFATAPDPGPEAPPPSRVEARLSQVRPDELSPREALELLYELKRL